MMYYVTIAWGEASDEVDTYHFKSLEEMEAFRYGVNETCGWLDYNVVDEGTVKT